MNYESELAIFNEARRLYPNTKRGNPTEFANFRRHKDWRKVLSLLKPAIEKQIQWRKEANGEFRPCWKHFERWINNRCWEDEITSSIADPKPKLCKPHGKPSVGSVQGKGVYCSIECRKQIAGW